jgi:thioesterase domain-containing protein
MTSEGKTSPMIEALTPIWQRVLRLSTVSDEDNFFDLGGTPSLAQTLFAEIANVCGRDVPPVTICYAPSISALATMLERPVIKPLAPIIQLRPGSPGFEGPPVFITHGIGASVLDLVKLARGIATEQPIYGMQVRGMDGIEEPFTRIEDVSQWFIEGVKQVQPHGPYFLVGYSLGGLITLEMAQSLSARNEKIALLALLDSYPDIHRLPALQRVRLTFRRAHRRAAAFFRSAQHRQTSHTERRIHNRLLSGSLVVRALEKVRESSYLALRNYEPKFYSGNIRFVRADIGTHFPENPIAVWAHLAGKFEVETIPGDHLEMLTTHCEKLASILSRYF